MNLGFLLYIHVGTLENTGIEQDETPKMTICKQIPSIQLHYNSVSCFSQIWDSRAIDPYPPTDISDNELLLYNLLVGTPRGKDSTKT